MSTRIKSNYIDEQLEDGFMDLARDLGHVCFRHEGQAIVLRRGARAKDFDPGTHHIYRASTVAAYLWVEGGRLALRIFHDPERGDMRTFTDESLELCSPYVQDDFKALILGLAQG